MALSTHFARGGRGDTYSSFGQREPPEHPLTRWSCALHDGCSASSWVEAPGVASSAAPALLTPMRLASQRVSGNVSNMTATNRVIGSARKAPGPPSSQAQITNDRKTIVGEMFKPRPIIIGERTFS